LKRPFRHIHGGVRGGQKKKKKKKNAGEVRAADICPNRRVTPYTQGGERCWCRRGVPKEKRSGGFFPKAGPKTGKRNLAGAREGEIEKGGFFAQAKTSMMGGRSLGFQSTRRGSGEHGGKTRQFVGHKLKRTRMRIGGSRVHTSQRGENCGVGKKGLGGLTSLQGHQKGRKAHETNKCGKTAEGKNMEMGRSPECCGQWLLVGGK